jgi:Cu+-exporting ATPase
LLLITMAHDLAGHLLEHLASPATLRWVELALATPVVFWGGWPFFVRVWQSLVFHSLNMFTLIGLGVSVAFVYSLVATLFPSVFPASFRNVDGLVAVYFEAAAAIVTLWLYRMNGSNVGTPPGTSCITALATAQVTASTCRRSLE